MILDETGAEPLDCAERLVKGDADIERNRLYDQFVSRHPELERR